MAGVDSIARATLYVHHFFAHPVSVSRTCSPRNNAMNVVVLYLGI